LNLRIATQIKVLREQQKLSQKDLAEKLGTKQTAISRLESANYSRWSVRVLKRLAKAFDLRLRISFEEFGTLWREVDEFSREELERRPFKEDPEFQAQPSANACADLINLPHHGGKSAIWELMISQQQTRANDREVIPINKSSLWNRNIPAKPARSAASLIGNSSDHERMAGCI
jgi:transcriptional regulator with XRE-family HTH domain